MTGRSSQVEPVRTTGHEANKPVKRDVSRLMRAGIALAVLGVLAWLGGCSDGPSDPCSTCPPPPQGLIVSDPAPAGGVAARAGTAAAPASGAGDSVAYVSLAPGTVPAGSRATLRRVGDAATVTDTVREGGFDPLPIGARAGDSIEVMVRDAGGATVYQVRAEVRAARPPVVVRTDPPRKKTDVPVNAALVVVFSEPVAGGTLTPSSVQLLRGGSPVAGTVSLLQGTGAVAAFTPTAPLDRNTDYRLVVTRVVRDLDGDALAAGDTVVFTTGQSSTGPAATIMLSPDSVFITAGATYQLTATVRDASGNMLIDQPVTWATSDPAGLTVSPTGLVTALADGASFATATVNGLTASAAFTVAATPPASVTVTPALASVAAGDTIILSATVRDATDRVIRFPTVTWTSSAPAAATVASSSSGAPGPALGTVTGVSQGSATVTASSGTVRGTAAVTVIPPQPVATVTVTPAAVAVVVQGKVQLAAVLRDANNRVIFGRPVAWATDNAAVATVDANGLVTGVGVGTAAVTATSEGVSDTAAITVALLSFGSVAAGGSHTCGLTPDGAAYCWGSNVYGELGTGSNTGPERCDAFSCSRVPVAVTGELIFSAPTLTAGNVHACGLTASGAAYCWGYNGEGELGDGSRTDRTRPVAVQGGLSFVAVSAGGGHTCGVTTGGAAYCWGSNTVGQLGAITDPTIWERPVAVQGGFSFVAVTAGGNHTCGLTSAGAAYCWGGGYGFMPVAVVAGPSFAAVSAGGGHTCGLTSAGVAYCWGGNSYGQLGDGSTTSRPGLVPVLGGLSFSAVSAGGQHTCGVTTGGAAYCWGSNDGGALGDGTTTDRTSPVAVLGGLTFTAVNAGNLNWEHTCGVITGGATYCWGRNYTGTLGNGTRTDSSVPVKVAGQP